MRNLKKILLVLLCSSMSLLAVACGAPSKESSTGSVSESTTESSIDSATDSTPDVAYYKVTFVQSGSEDVVITVKEGESVAEAQIPALNAKEGYTVAWEEVDLSNITEDITVEATYTANKYTVTYDANGGTVANATQEVTYDSDYTLATPEKDGHTFAAWLLDGKAVTQEGNWKTASDVTLVASWTLIEDAVFTVTFVQNGQEPIEVKVDAGSDLSDIPTPVAKTGYTVEWDRTDFTNITENITVTAVETPMTFTVSFDGNGASYDTTKSVSYDEEINWENPVKAGYIFLGWFIVDADGNATSEKFTDAVWNRLDGLSLIAQWEEDFSSNDGYTDRY